MSDDGYYAGSNYDELEDLLWDADPVPDLADDLAEHAAYSPVWQDDPLGELEPYHSDWEYYSDDYYDDDPAILRRNPMDGGPTNTTSHMNTVRHKRGRKRKLDEAREALMYDERTSLASCIQGTVWAQDSVDRDIIFQRGSQEEVALLADWRKLFEKDGGNHLFGRGQLRRDETWANDLGLTDMGLLSQRENASAPEATAFEDEAGGSAITNSDDGYEEQLTDDKSDSEVVQNTAGSRGQNHHGISSQNSQVEDNKADFYSHRNHHHEILLATSGLPHDTASVAAELLSNRKLSRPNHESTSQNSAKVQSAACEVPSTIQTAHTLAPPRGKRKRSPGTESENANVHSEQRRVRPRTSNEALLDNGKHIEEPPPRSVRKSARTSRK